MGAPTTSSSKEECQAELQQLLIQLLHVALGEPEEPRPPAEMEYLAEAVARALGSSSDLPTARKILIAFSDLAREYGIDPACE